MPAPDLIRDSFVGQLIYYATGRRLFHYLEDRPEFILPPKYEKAQRDLESPGSDNNSETATLADRKKPEQGVSEKSSEAVTINDAVRPDHRPEMEESTVGQEILRSPTREIEKGKLAEELQRRADEDQENPYLVTWYSHDDQENPQNVS